MISLSLRAATIRFISLIIVLFFSFSATACSPKSELTLGEVENNEDSIVVGSIDAPGEYSTDGAKGPYADVTIGDKLMTFLGVRDYNPAGDESDNLEAGHKALVAAFSLETLPSGESFKFASSYFKLVHVPSSVTYNVKWNKDEEVEIEDEKIAGEIGCYRLVFQVPEDVKIDDCLVLYQNPSMKTYERFSMGSPQEDINGTAIDYVNMCPLCSSATYDYKHLSIGTCEICSRKFTSGHSPCQRSCFACSVIYNYCTQCLRYIESNNTTIIKKK